MENDFVSHSFLLKLFIWVLYCFVHSHKSLGESLYWSIIKCIKVCRSESWYAWNHTRVFKVYWLLDALRLTSLYSYTDSHTECSHPSLGPFVRTVYIYTKEGGFLGSGLTLCFSPKPHSFVCWICCCKHCLIVLTQVCLFVSKMFHQEYGII